MDKEDLTKVPPALEHLLRDGSDHPGVYDFPHPIGLDAFIIEAPKLQSVTISQIDSNPFRDLTTYPFIEKKVAALQRSINTVGLWEGVIVRQVGERYQTAFGHHRIEAAKRQGLTEATLILRDLDDEQMIQFMGRENMADYNADFLTMLETWDAAVQHLESVSVKNPQAIAITQLLGWTQARSGGGEQMSRTAEACNSTHKLLQGGVLKREQLADLTVSQVREICVRAQADIDRIRKQAAKTKRPMAEVKAAEKQIAKAVVKTAKEASRGEVRQTDLRSKVDINTYRFAKEAKKKSPLFAQFGKQLANCIDKMLMDDATKTKLENIQNSLPDITLNEDFAVMRSIDFALGELEKRAAKWRASLSIDSENPTEGTRRGKIG
jgi:ParB/RepB/Spo0J family partition protein